MDSRPKPRWRLVFVPPVCGPWSVSSRRSAFQQLEILRTHPYARPSYAVQAVVVQKDLRDGTSWRRHAIIFFNRRKSDAPK